MQKVEISIPTKKDLSIKCPNCKTRKIDIVAGAIDEPCELPAKCECGEQFTINFALQ